VHRLGHGAIRTDLSATSIQPKTRDEVRALADQVIDQIIAKLPSRKVQQAAYALIDPFVGCRAPFLF
jgi:hypothetical protein